MLLSLPRYGPMLSHKRSWPRYNHTQGSEDVQLLLKLRRSSQKPFSTDVKLRCIVMGYEKYKKVECALPARQT